MATIQSTDLQLLTHQQLASLTYQLAIEIAATHPRLDRIVSIHRGGSFVARYLSDFFSLPIVVLGLQSYVGIDKKGQIQVVQDFSESLKGHRILLVDEICDTGATFVAALRHLEKKGVRDVITAAPIVKPHTTYQPNFSAVTTKKWVVFPYELAETVQQVRAASGGELSEDVSTLLRTHYKELGLSQEQIKAIGL